MAEPLHLQKHTRSLKLIALSTSLSFILSLLRSSIHFTDDFYEKEISLCRSHTPYMHTTHFIDLRHDHFINPSNKWESVFKTELKTLLRTKWLRKTTRLMRDRIVPRPAMAYIHTLALCIVFSLNEWHWCWCLRQPCFLNRLWWQTQYFHLNTFLTIRAVVPFIVYYTIIHDARSVHIHYSKHFRNINPFLFHLTRQSYTDLVQSFSVCVWERV